MIGRFQPGRCSQQRVSNDTADDIKGIERTAHGSDQEDNAEHGYDSYPLIVSNTMKHNFNLLCHPQAPAALLCFCQARYLNSQGSDVLLVPDIHVGDMEIHGAGIAAASRHHHHRGRHRRKRGL